MSLLDRGRTLATVYPLVHVDDGYGGTQPGAGEPITMRVVVHPSSTKTEAGDGYLLEDTYTVTARSLPDEVYEVEFDGHTWHPEGAVRRFRAGSRATRHDALLVRRA